MSATNGLHAATTRPSRPGWDTILAATVRPHEWYSIRTHPPPSSKTVPEPAVS
ncbi:hypothetical protein FRC07_014557, partial [Ceratobasidium sp. 392]